MMNKSNFKRFLVRNLTFVAIMFSSAMFLNNQLEAKVQTGRYANSRAEVQLFTQALAQKNGIPIDFIQSNLEQARYVNASAKLMYPPKTPAQKDWQNYRARFLDEVRISRGVEFWRKYALELAKAREQYGVPEEIIVGIIGVETIYGQEMGNFRVLDVLATLSFDYPNTGKDRSAEFKAQLEAFLVFCHERNINPTVVKGSFAGAIGMPQFMPSSYRQYGVDFDGDGKIELRTNPVDVIGSVANFLAQHGWQRNQAISYPISFVGTPNIEALLKVGPLPQFTINDLKAYGVTSNANIPETQKLLLVDLPNAYQPTQFMLGTQNFYVITRYNKSFFYATSVMELGNAIKARL